MDGSVLNPVIAFETAYTGCAPPRVCYSVTHTNVRDIVAGSTIRFLLTGTFNPYAVEPAGVWGAQTQLKQLSDGAYFNIDRGAFDANSFIATVGAVFLTTNKAIFVSDPTTYQTPVSYTVFFTLAQFVLEGGIIKVTLPAEVTIESDPYATFKSPSPLASGKSYDRSSVAFQATGTVAAGPVEITFGGVRNPSSFEPSGIFRIETFDQAGHPIGQGNIDYVQMSKMRPFTFMTVVPRDPTNGATTDYVITFKPTLPLKDGDLFHLLLPFSGDIQAPKEPACAAQQCLQSIACTSESRKLTFTLVNPRCAAEGSEYSFSISGVRNPYSMVTSWPLQAYVQSATYQNMTTYLGNQVTITNTKWGILDPTLVALDQRDRNYNTYSLYTIRFKPTNPIPPIGAVKLTYPKTIKVKSRADFLSSCQAITDLMYGEKNCLLDESTNTVWFLGIFTNQQQYTSQISLNMYFLNPTSNIQPTLTAAE